MGKKNLKRNFAALTLACIAAGSISANVPKWMRDAKISPDGSQIAFSYMGDIWVVPSQGGEAKRLTMTDNAFEADPIWSPDGQTIAFRSDRAGNFDIFTISKNGGEASRLTFNSVAETPEAFTPDGKNILFSAAIQNPAQSSLFPSSRMTELYSISVNGGNPVLVQATPVQLPVFSPVDNNILFYQDNKGMEDEWRKHHTSSVTRDVWKLDLSTGTHTNLTKRGGEDRNPVVSPDGKKLYFLSERDGGSMNVYSTSVDDGKSVEKVTSFTTHPVRFLSGAKNGTLSFTYDGDIYTMKPGEQPKKVNITVTTDHYQPVKKIDVRSTADAVPSPDGKYVAFTNRGDIFVTSVEYPTTKQITNTTEAESQIQWHPDGKKIVYTSERDGHWNIYTAEPSRSDDPDFPNATLIKEEPLFPASDGIERTYPSFSPDGKKLAYIEDRNKLMVKDLATGNVKQLTDGHTYYSRNGGFDYQWSPDGNWIVAEGILHRHDPYSDIFLVNVNDATMIPLTETGYFDESPRFVLDGNAVIFNSDRFGMRNHASWGSQQDVMIVFLNEDAYDKFRLSEEDYALVKDLEKKAGEKKASDKSDVKNKDAKTPKDEKPKEIKVEKKGIQDRLIRLTPASSNLAGAAIPDGDNLYYLAAFERGYDLWKKDLRKGDVKMVNKLGGAPASLATDKDGKSMFILSGNGVKKMDVKGEKITPVSIGGKMLLDEAAERNYMFDYVKRQEREMFYDTTMHGVDWENLTEHYRQFLPHITNNYDFAELLSELLGELNVSHTGGRYSAPANPNNERTASLGLLFDLSGNTDNGLLVTEVLEGGPMDKSWSKIKAGDKVTAINGKKIEPGTPWATLLADLAGSKTLVTFVTPEGITDEEVILPISAGEESELLYQRWIKQRAADVEKWSNGRLGYVHIRSMGDPSFRDVYADVLGKYNELDGIVIDIRWNGGGRLHEDIEVLFSGNKYFTQVVRGNEACDMPSRRWNKPSIMVQCEACYSNAHGTPWVYKHTGIGKLVGAPVAGTMTSVNWVRMQDPTMVFGIPVTGYRLPDGSYLENTQLEPDIYVLNTPEQVAAGEDAQLKAAVDALLSEIDNK